MTTYPPSFCPRCGSTVDDHEVDGHDHAFCPACEEIVFHNPVPGANVTVVDGDRVLLIQRARPPGVGSWSIPGGHLETAETPREGAARELREETDLTVAPDVLQLASDQYLGEREGKHMVTFGYAVRLDDCDGSPAAGSDARDWAFVDAEGIVEGDIDRPILPETRPRVELALARLASSAGPKPPSE